jgi:glycosyltransferase involved in cell wall biosynthesis
MKTIFLTRFRPDAVDGGSALRNRQNIFGLGKSGPVDVVSIGADGEAAPLEGVRDWTHFSLREALAGRSRGERVRRRLWRLRAGAHPVVEQYLHERVARFLEDVVNRERYDVAVVSEVFLASYLPLFRRLGCKVVFDCHNIESALATDVDAARSKRAPLGYRLSVGLLQRRMHASERQAARDADVVWACSEADARGLEDLFGLSKRVAVVPNGVDVSSYAPAEETNGTAWSRSVVTLLYPGTFSYFPNEDAAMRLIDEVLPALRARGREARVLLVGRSPTAAMLAAAERDPGVIVTGPVASVLPYFHRPAVVTLPIRVGSGTRLKVLEAYAARCPVVSTAKGVEGISGRDGEHHFVREDGGGTAEAVLRVWDDEGLRRALTANAAALVEREYSRDAAVRRIAESLAV